MDMNFPHTDLGQIRDGGASDFRALLSNAMAKQMVSPTYRAMTRRAMRNPRRGLSAESKLRDHIRYFAGQGTYTPRGAFLPKSNNLHTRCAPAGHNDEATVYQTGSSNSKEPNVKPLNATASNENI